MSLSSGTRLGPYEIVAPLGAGGMGEVYRARDTRLGRSVAIKVLPAEFAADTRLRLRFEREAQAISALNHPHICTLYDIGPDYLVMEHCDGKTLARRLADGPVAIGQAIEYATHLADALDKAHRQGITHRDLKPSNIMIVKSGAKILDFGLAKQLGAASADDSTLEQATKQGVIVGTIQYMPPEVLSGKDADARSDIFALGCVMYEMVTGKPAFSGTSKATIIAAILEHEPTPIATLRPDVPPSFVRLINTCLNKDPDQRFQSAHDVLLELKWSAEATSSTYVRRPNVWLALAATVVIIIATAVVTTIATKRRVDVTPHPIRRLVVPLLSRPAWFAISPDGTLLVFESEDGALYRRRLDNLAAEKIAGTEGSAAPFFSPDGNWIAFVSRGRLQKVPTGGGAPVTICENVRPRGAVWLTNDTIVFGLMDGPLMSVPVSGGIPRVITKRTADGSIRWPMPLPDAKHVLVTVTDGSGDPDRYEIAVVDLADGTVRTLIRGATYGQYASTGHIVFSRSSTVHRVSFDPQAMKTTGEPQPIIDDAGHRSAMGFAFVVVSGRTIYYVPREPSAASREIVWVDRRGRVTLAVQKRQGYCPLGMLAPQLSPDGNQIAVSVCNVMDRGAGEAGRDCDVWTYEIARATWNRLTSDGHGANPIWSPDGRRIAYWSNRNGPFNVFLVQADGGGESSQLTHSKGWPCPTSWSPDAKLIAVTEQLGTTGYDLGFAAADGKQGPFAYLRTPFFESTAVFSPDGHWLAYESNQSGQFEIYVRAVSGNDAAYKVSEGGGSGPRWRRDGRELFYSSQKAMLSVSVTATPSLLIGKPQTIFQLPASILGASFDVSADGQRFLMLRGPQVPPQTQINVADGLLD